MNIQRIISILILQLCCGCYTEKFDNYRGTIELYNQQLNVNYINLTTSSQMEENKTVPLESILLVSTSISNYSSNESSTETSLSEDDSYVIQTNGTLHLSKNPFSEVDAEESQEETSSPTSNNPTRNFKTNTFLTVTNELTNNSTKYLNKEKITQRMLLKNSDELSTRTKMTMEIIKKASSIWKSTTFPSNYIKHRYTSDRSSPLMESTWHKNTISTLPRRFLDVIIHIFTSEPQQHDKPNKYSNENVNQSSDSNSNEIYNKNIGQRSASIKNNKIKLSKLTTVQPITTNRLLHKITKQLLNRFTSSISTKKAFFNPSTKYVENYRFNNKSLDSTLSSRTVLQRTTQLNWKIRDTSLSSSMFEKVCDLERDEGFGSDSFSSWYFNAKNGKCEWFSYRGNGGNGNRFYHRANCENSCIEKHENICLQFEIVNCVESWLHCKIESDFSCEHISKTKELDVSLFCPPKQPICVNEKLNIRKSPIYRSHLSLIPTDCFLPKDFGTCNQDSGSPLVYYYDPTINDCLGFLHSNCGGNSNKYFSKPNCMNRCAI